MTTKELLLAEIEKLNDIQIDQVCRHALRLARWQALAADKRCILDKLQDV